MQNTNTNDVPKFKFTANKLTVLLVLLLVTVTVVSISLYFVQQSQLAVFSQENRNLQEKLNTGVSTEDKLFKLAGTPLIFNYPGAWTLIINEPLEEIATTPDNYKLELFAPGALIKESPLGGDFVENGGRIVIRAEKTNFTKPGDYLKQGIYKRSAKNIKNIAIDSSPAVQYEFGYESDPGIYTDIIKNGILYSIAFYSDEADEKISSLYPDYQRLIDSIKFN